MPYLIIENFGAGLDTRRHPMVAPPGTLRRCNNAHITRGGEISKRRAFVPIYALPSGTRNLAVTQNRLYVFGSDVEPGGMPPQVTYQQLEHPSAVPLDRVMSYDTYDGKIYAVARFTDGSIFHYYDGERVTDWYDGRARASFTCVSGQAPEGVDPDPPTTPDSIDAVTVDGIDILGGPVSWGYSAEETAQLVVDAINGFVSSPNYTASRFNRTVNIIAEDPGIAPNNLPVIITPGGGAQVNPTDTLMLGGVDSEELVPGTYVKTAQNKMYAVSGSLMHYSGIDQPTRWTEDVGVTGSGFINMENQDGQSEVLVALERYYSRMAVLGRRSIQIWQIDVDPSQNAQVQVLRNSGTICARSVQQVGDNDVYFLADSGVRSVRARDSSTAGQVNDVGAPIDETMVSYVQALGPATVSEGVAVIEPIAGRYWLALGGQVFTFSQFPGNKVAAWTTYTPGFSITDFAVIDDALYCRSGDVIYLVGGVDLDTFDTDLVEVELPLLDAEKPAHFKTWSAIDLVCQGTWRVFAGFEPLVPEARELIAVVSSPTLSMQRIPLNGYGTHASILLENDLAEEARLSNFILHYELADVG